ncbi:MAG TPA: hypothetical protein VLT57_06955 [Bryobacteraceae bacterium]|nr:hypothetical protein [Bryobacteraceae bacterium]
MSKYTGKMPLRRNFTTRDIRARFEVLCEELDQHYDHGMWDDAVAASYLVREAVRASERKPNA